MRDKTNSAAGDNIFNDVLADIVESMAATEFVVTTLHRVPQRNDIHPEFRPPILGSKNVRFSRLVPRIRLECIQEYQECPTCPEATPRMTM